MGMKIMWAAILAFGGWLGYYLFGRQLVYNFVTAFPLIRQMTETQEDLIAPGAKRYTVISAIVMGVLCIIICVAVFLLCPLYLKISFAAGCFTESAHGHRKARNPLDFGPTAGKSKQKMFRILPPITRRAPGCGSGIPFLTGCVD